MIQTVKFTPSLLLLWESLKLQATSLWIKNGLWSSDFLGNYSFHYKLLNWILDKATQLEIDLKVLNIITSAKNSFSKQGPIHRLRGLERGHIPWGATHHSPRYNHQSILEPESSVLEMSLGFEKTTFSIIILWRPPLPSFYRLPIMILWKNVEVVCNQLRIVISQTRRGINAFPRSKHFCRSFLFVFVRKLSKK